MSAILLDSAIELVKSRKGFTLDGPDGGTLILDKYGRRVFRLDDQQGQESEVSLAGRLIAFFDEANAAPASPALRFTVHILFEALGQPGFWRTLALLARQLSAAGSVHLAFHFSSPPKDWHCLLGPLRHFRDFLKEPSGGASITGPFDGMPDQLKELVVALNVQLRLAAGWRKGPSVDSYASFDAETLTDLACFGLRVPVVWYVHQGNVARVLQLLPAVLESNYNSGFALPLVSQNPYYGFNAEEPALPGEDEYSGLLAEAYRDYPHYDDVFAPIDELTRLVVRGGWSAPERTPAEISLLLAPEGVVGAFRQSPALARPWLRWAAVDALGEAALVPALLEWHRSEFAWDKNPYCNPCPWRYVCGGLDSRTNQAFPPRAVLNVVCEHRKFLMEALVLQLRLS